MKGGFCLTGVWMLILVSPYGQASTFFEDHARGWHWYEPLEAQPLEAPSPSQKPEDQKTEKLKLEKAQPDTKDPSETLEKDKEQIKQRLAAALINPTPQNLYAYMALQKQTMERAHHFAQVWQEVVLRYPELDDTLKFPTTQTGRHIFYDQEKQQLFQSIQSLKDTHGLYFFFSKNCPYCKAFAPIVKTFAEKYGWQVLAVSLDHLDGNNLDGEPSQEFKDVVKANGMAQKLGVTHVPALFVVNPGQSTVLPIAHGLVSEAEIEQRILLLTKGGRP